MTLKPDRLISLILVTASLCAAPTTLLAVAQNAFTTTQGLQVTKPCAGCHRDARGQNLKAAGDCAECHDVGAGQSRMVRIAATSAGTQERSAAPSSGKGLGMRLPMYYPVTRAGATPNPMVRVPAGKFIRGTDTRFSDEGPQHTVDLQAFLIDKYEVTNLQYQQFIAATGRKSPGHFSNRTFPEGKADHPVTFVSWEDAHDYCAWAGKRLPTGQEWEKAARGTDGRTFPWGDESALNKANTPARWQSLRQEGDTTPVGAFAAGVSPYGAYDMSGNVWEWTDSWYQAYPGNKKQSENYGEQYKTLKGGSWWDCSFYQCGISSPVYNRAFFNIKVKNATFGFRCAKDAK